MIGSVGSSNTSVLIAAAMKEATTTQDIQIAVLKIGQNIDKANGEAVLQLIASASGTSAGGIDIHV